MFCINCGKQINDGSKFCPECGAKIEDPIQTGPSILEGDEDTVLLTDDGLNANFDGGEDTVLLTEDEPVAESGPSLLAGDEDTVLLTDTDDGLNANFDGGEDTVLLTEDEPAIGITNDVTDNHIEKIPAAEPVIESAAASAADSIGSDVFGGVAQSSDVFGNVDPFAGIDSAPEPEPVPEPVPEPAPSVFDDNTDTMAIPPVQPEYPKDNKPEYPKNSGSKYQKSGIPQKQEEPRFDEPEISEPEPEKTDVKIGAGRIIGGSIISVFAIIALFVLSMIFSLKFGASGKTLRKNVEKLDGNSLFSAEFEDEEISGDIYKTLGINGISDGKADKDSFKKYLVESDILDFAGERIENYAKYVMEGKGDDPSVTADEITEEFFGSKENNKIAKKEMGFKFRSGDLKKINERLEKNDIDKNLSVDEWSDSVGFNVKNCSYIFSWVTIGIIGALILLLLIWIAVIVDRKGRHLAGFYGRIFGISGGLMFLIGAGVLAASPILFAITNNVIFYAVFHILLTFGIFAISIGAGELILSFIFNKIRKGLKGKEKIAKVKAETEKKMQEEFQHQ